MPVGGLCSTAGHNQKLPLHLAAISALLQGQGASTKWLCSPPRPGYTPATLPLPLPRLGFSHSKTSRAWARIPGGYGKAGTDFIPCDYVTPWLQTLELSTRCFPSYHQQLKREAGDWKNPEVPYGTKRQAGRDPPCNASSSASHPSSVTGRPGTLHLRIFWRYKKPDLYTANSDGIDPSSCPCLTSGSSNRLPGGVKPTAKKHGYAVTLCAPRQVIHCARLDSVPSNNLTFVKKKEPIRN